jgi:endonuclease/exonuclease/phosphatase family metal-dependent hydrolase
MPDALHVATLNLRNIADRWPVQQDRILGAAGEARYQSRRGWAGRPEYGNAVLVREPLRADDGDRLDLGASRSALRVPVSVPGGRLDFVVTHLHHLVPDEAMRAQQAAKLTSWLEDITWPLVVVGDFNAEPEEPAYRQMVDAGFTSAFAAANGKEPDVTWPSGIKAPGMDLDGDPGCLDYIWVRGAIAVESCRLAFDRPAVHDATLYPSDHLGLSARLLVG